VAAAIADKLRQREEHLDRVCQAANVSNDVAAIESSFDALTGKSDIVQEPW